MKTKVTILVLFTTALVSTAFAGEGHTPGGIPHLDHVFLIMMENHGYSQIFNNPNAPFINQMAASANFATNYFAIAHPSLTNYLETVGGSNFGIHTDQYPDWHNITCTTNLASGTVATDNPASGLICPIWGSGTDAATPAQDCTNEVQSPPAATCDNNIDGTQSIAAAGNTAGMTIADQLSDKGLSWKSYQESLPHGGADGVNYSDGFFTNNTDFSKILPALTPPLSQSNIVFLYAVKHNPFAYFQSVQEGFTPGSSLSNTVGFDGAAGLYADLASGNVPNFAFIAPNQCNDQHGRGNGTAFCNFDPTDNGTQAGLNPGLILQGDMAVRQITTAIKSSKVWSQGNNAIVLVWDENDYSQAPNTNQVLLVVDTNYGIHGLKSAAPYNHFSLLKSLESGFGLPCLNHACDSNINTMTDLFGGE